MSRFRSRTHLALERAVGWLDRSFLGTFLRALCALAIAWIPTAQEFADAKEPASLVRIATFFADPRWLIGFFIALTGLAVLSHYQQGTPARRLIRSLASINGSFAGTLETLGSKIESAHRRRLDDNQCENLCTALLHRIRDYTAVALEVSDSSKLRATLAVPVHDANGNIEALRVWCYDEPYLVRGYTRIPIMVDGEVAPGAPAAFSHGDVQIIKNIRDVPGPPSNTARTYESVLCFPVPARDGNGKPLAVVSIDADEPDFFAADRVASDVRPLISPVLSAIGLVLLSRQKKGQPYAFPR